MGAPRQLTIRDDEIYELAHGIAERQGVSATEAVRLALKAYRVPKPHGDFDRARRLAELRRITDQLAQHMEPGSHESDDAALYDEYGLPR